MVVYGNEIPAHCCRRRGIMFQRTRALSESSARLEVLNRLSAENRNSNSITDSIH